MIALLDTSDALDKCASELGVEHVGELFTPLTGRNPKNPIGVFAIDNGAFARFEPNGFMSLLVKHKPRIEYCRFVAVPDVVGSAIRTLEVFDYWAPKLKGWPLALVAQDGQEEWPIPWHRISAVFLGGSTEWKMSHYAASIAKAGMAMGKWVHAGRVNSPGRFEYFEKLGVDSIDGTGLSRYSHMRRAIHLNNTEPQLLTC